MATTPIRLVQGDTGPPLIVQLTDEETRLPIDLSAGTASVAMKFRAAGTTITLATLAGTKLTGFTNPDGSIDTADYPTAGQGGRVSIAWGSTTLAVTPGAYEGQIVITTSGPVVQTVYDLIKFTIRPA